MASDLAPSPSTPVLPLTRPSPPPWIFGVLILPLGMYLGFIWTALPFLLSKAGVAVEDISHISALLQIPPILMFLWTPVVDVRLRRQTWLVLGAAGAAICMWLACPLVSPSRVNLLAAILFFAGMVLALVAASTGGLMATLLSVPGTIQSVRLGTWPVILAAFSERQSFFGSLSASPCQSWAWLLPR